MLGSIVANPSDETHRACIEKTDWDVHDAVVDDEVVVKGEARSVLQEESGGVVVAVVVVVVVVGAVVGVVVVVVVGVVVVLFKVGSVVEVLVVVVVAVVDVGGVVVVDVVDIVVGVVVGGGGIGVTVGDTRSGGLAVGVTESTIEAVAVLQLLMEMFMLEDVVNTPSATVRMDRVPLTIDIALLTSI